MKKMKWLWLVVLAILAAGTALTAEKETNMQKYDSLNAEEKRVILNKGTEMAFTGEYWNHFEEGAYVCRQCKTPLYNSTSKFESQCGWPSFDDEIPGAVKRKTDADGRRTEIICNNCNGHLGHVFIGEGFTEKNTRHCVNSVSIKFVPEKPVTERAIFAGGCFWGVEHHFQKTPGVLETTVGYTGGHIDNPTYQQVCSGRTGHIEAMEVRYDPSVVSYEKLAKLFFEIHDPTQLDQQGPDIGQQYRSAVFYLNEEQKTTSQKLMNLLKEKGYDVVTQLSAAKTFYPAENYHQDYYQHKGALPYCHFYTKRFDD